MEGEVFRENRFSSGKIILTYKENFVLSSLYHRGELIASKKLKIGGKNRLPIFGGEKSGGAERMRQVWRASLQIVDPRAYRCKASLPKPFRSRK